MVNHRHTFHVMHNRMRKRPFYHHHHQQKWRPSFIPPDSRYKYNGGYTILWELEKIDRQIQKIQSQICVLKQQLRIIQTHCVPIDQDDILTR